MLIKRYGKQKRRKGSRMSEYRMPPLGDILPVHSTPKQYHSPTPKKVQQYYFPTPKKREEPKKVQQYSFSSPKKEQTGLTMAYYHRYMPLDLTQEEVNYIERGEIKRAGWLKRHTDQRKELKWA